MGVNSGAYDVVMVLHVMCVIIGFGGVFLNGIYGAQSKRLGGREGLAIFEATEKVAKVSEGFILAVPVFGIALVLMSHSTWKFSQAWVMAALTIYALVLFIAFGLHIPNLNRMRGLMSDLVGMSELPAVAGGSGEGGSAGASAGPPPQVAELEARGKRAAALGGMLNLAVIAVVIFMVWKPGS